MKRLIINSILALIFVVSYSSAQTEKIVNGDFEAAEVTPWSLQLQSSGEGTLDASTTSPISGTKSGHVTITAKATVFYGTQLLQSFYVGENKRYIISYKIKASKDTVVSVGIQQNHTPYSSLYGKDINVTTTVQSFKDSTDALTIDSVNILFSLGNLSPGIELWVDDVSIIEKNIPVVIKVKAPGPNVIVNGNFESGATPWVTELASGGAATYTLDNTNAIEGSQSAKIQVTNAGTADYHVQFKQPMAVKKDKRYFILYRARASKDNVVIKAGIQEYHDSYAFLTQFKAETLKTVTKTFYDTSGYIAADDNNVKFTFMLGNQGVVDVWIDQVTIVENTMASPLDIVIDAERDAWYDQLTNPDDGKIFLPARAYLRDVGTAPPAGGNDDISAVFWTAWDKNYLYYYAEVRDDAVLDNNSTNWSNDKIELKFDPDPSIIATGGALQVGISALSLDDPGTVAGAIDNLDADKNLYYANKTQWAVDPTDYARKLTDKGYVLEWRIPITAINSSDGARKLSPGVDGKFGIAINLADNDDTQRSNMLQWSSGFADNAWSNPQKHGTVTFLENNKLNWRAVSSQDSVQYRGPYNGDSTVTWYYGGAGPTKVKPGSNGIPGSYSLEQNYPNPFNPSTTIEFAVPERSNVRIVLMNMLGQVVKEVVNNEYTAGTHRVQLNASSLASGVYFYRMQAGNFVDTRKLVFMK